MKKKFLIKFITANLNNFIAVNKIIFKKKLKNTNVASLPLKQKRFVLLKSPHVNKKSKEHFQIKYYQKLYFITFRSKNQLKEFLLNLPNDLNIFIKKIIKQ